MNAIVVDSIIDAMLANESISLLRRSVSSGWRRVVSDRRSVVVSAENIIFFIAFLCLSANLFASYSFRI